MNWEDVRKDKLTVNHNGIDRTVILYQYVGALADCLPKIRVDKHSKPVNHKQMLQQAYLQGGQDAINKYVQDTMDMDYIRKSGYYWDILSPSTREAVASYLGVGDVMKEKIDILVKIDLQRFSKLEGVTELNKIEVQSMLEHTGLMEILRKDETQE